MLLWRQPDREGLVREFHGHQTFVLPWDSFFLLLVMNGNFYVGTDLLSLSPVHSSGPANPPLDTVATMTIVGTGKCLKSIQSELMLATVWKPRPTSSYFLPPRRDTGGTRSLWHCRRPESSYSCGQVNPRTLQLCPKWPSIMQWLLSKCYWLTCGRKRS